jgi:hypothetical protein
LRNYKKKLKENVRETVRDGCSLMRSQGAESSSQRLPTSHEFHHLVIEIIVKKS